MNRRDFLMFVIGAAPALVLLADVDTKRALWTPKPMVTVPGPKAAYTLIGVDYGCVAPYTVVTVHENAERIVHWYPCRVDKELRNISIKGAL